MPEYEIGKDMAALQQEVATLRSDLRETEDELTEVSSQSGALIESLKAEGLISWPDGMDTWILHPAVADLIHPKGEGED